MKIGILGSGNVGASLGALVSLHGHEVVFGMRDPKKGPPPGGRNTRADTIENAAQFGDVVVLATPWDATAEVLRRAGDLSGKVVIDCTNPLAPGLTGLVVGNTDSAGETVARLAPNARVVKCFNTLGAQGFGTPSFRDQVASMFFCGNDPEAKDVVAKIGAELGFDMIDVGPLAQARLLEPLAMLWISLAYKEGFGPNIAFKLLRRQERVVP